MGKKWYASKTLWVNVGAVIAFIIQSKTGNAMSLEGQSISLSVINICLRLITKDEIEW